MGHFLKVTGSMNANENVATILFSIIMQFSLLNPSGIRFPWFTVWEPSNKIRTDTSGAKLRDTKAGNQRLRNKKTSFCATWQSSVQHCQITASHLRLTKRCRWFALMGGGDFLCSENSLMNVETVKVWLSQLYFSTTSLVVGSIVGGVVWINLFFLSTTTLVIVQERLNCVQWSHCTVVKYSQNAVTQIRWRGIL